MTATQQFIEDAIKGGWRSDIPSHQHQSFIDGEQGDIRFALLDPLAWQAVGKTRGWKKDEFVGEIKRRGGGGEVIETRRIDWQPFQTKWHRFIDHLADGLSIEEALSKLV